MKIKFLVSIILSLTVLTFGQTGNITNTIAPNGSFLVKDGSNTFLTLSQANGFLSLNNSLSLPYTTSSSTGIIFKGADRFIHNYQAQGSDGFNTFVGVNAGNFTMSGSSNQASGNTGVGYSSLSSITIGYLNSAFGFRSLLSNTTGYYNVAFGGNSLVDNTEGNSNSAFGDAALFYNTTGSSNSACGFGALTQNTAGNANSAFGADALYSNISSDNSAFGSYALFNNTTGGNNSAFGNTSLYSNTTGIFNCAFGSQSLYYNTTGNCNSAFGVSALDLNTTGKFNSAFGFDAMGYNATGYHNSSFGDQSLFNNSTGFQNTSVGHKSLFTNVAGFQNTAVGDSALYYNTGNYNTALGYNAGSNVTTGANLTLVGIDANPSAGNATDEITLGNIYVQHLRCNVQTITSLSDARDKRNIRDLSLGLDFLMTLKPRLYNWDRREWYTDGKPDGTKMQQTPTAGFIAQELDTAQINAKAEYLNLVLKSNPERLEATPGNLLPIIVKAVQELKIKNEQEKIEKDKEIADLKIKNQNLEERLAKYEEIQSVLVKEFEQIESNNRSLKVQIVNTENKNQ